MNMKNKYLLVRVGCKPEIVEIETDEKGVTEDGFTKIQEYVGGWVESYRISGNSNNELFLLFDEEGRFKGKKLSMQLSNGVNIVGDVIVCSTISGVDKDGEPFSEFCGFTDKGAEDIKKLFESFAEGC